MDSEDISFFTQLPHDLQCQVLSLDIDVVTLLSIRSLSRKYYNLVTDCVKHLAPLSQGKSLSLNPQLILSLPNLITVSSDYPIKINRPEDLSELSQHPNLRKATFDLTEIIVIHPKNPFWGLEYFFSTKYKSRPTFSCQECNDPLTFNYTFFYQREGNSSLTRITDHTIDTRQTSINDIVDLLFTVQRYLDICQYHGKVRSYDIIEQLLNLPCLRDVTVWTIYGHVDVKGSIIPLLEKGIDVTIDNYALEDPVSRRGYANEIRAFSQETNQTFPELKSFIPIPTDRIAKIDKVFPNLTEISLLVETTLIPWRRLTKYEKIYLYVPSNLLPTITNNIPGNFTGRVVIIG